MMLTPWTRATTRSGSVTTVGSFSYPKCRFLTYGTAVGWSTDTEFFFASTLPRVSDRTLCLFTTTTHATSVGSRLLKLRSNAAPRSVIIPMTRQITDRVALVDLDGTVADYDGAMQSRMAALKAPDEADFTGWDDVPPYIKARRDLIKTHPGFWRTLPRLELGFQIVGELRRIGFEMHVLTKGPAVAVGAWTEKVEWCQENLPDAMVTVTQDKSLVFGRVLVDDFPPYFERWLQVRPRGLVIAVAHSWNAHIEHPNVVRYDGTNIGQVAERLQAAYDRESGRA